MSIQVFDSRTETYSETNFTEHFDATNSYGLNQDLFPFWILCEATSGILSILSIYIALVVVRYTTKQNPSRLARRQRDSATMLPAKVLFPPAQEQNSHKMSEMSSTSLSYENEPNHQNSRRVAYREQISVESAKSQTILITNSEEGKTVRQGHVIAVHRSKENDKGIWLIRAISVCAFLVVLRSISEQSLILVGHFSDTFCDVLTKTMTTLTALSIHCCHVFLWLRQLTFYSNPMLKPLRSKKLKIVSYAAYCIMPLSLAAVLALYMWWRDYESIDGACLGSSEQHLPAYLPFVVLVACTVAIQILLSALFLYPLIDHKMKRRSLARTKNKSTDSATDSGNEATHSASRPKRKDKLMACIRRVLCGATIGITTDVVGGLVSIFLPDDIPMFAYSVLYNLNVSLNLLCLIYTFADWRQMIFPWCCPSRVEREFRASKQRRRSSMKSIQSRDEGKGSRRDKSVQVFGKSYSIRSLD